MKEQRTMKGDAGVGVNSHGQRQPRKWDLMQ